MASRSRSSGWSRRRLLKAAGSGLPVATLFDPTAARRVEAAARAIAQLSPDAAARDETFWFAVQQAFDLDSRYIILNAGASNPMPRQVRTAFVRNIEFVNGSPLINNNSLAPQRETVRRRLARLVNCAPDEIAITRNSTEASNIVLSGWPLKPGEEVLTTEWDYSTLLDALRMREKRHGIVVRSIPIQWPVTDQRVLVTAFERALTPATRLILICHVVDGVGHIMPVRAICDLARARGVPVLVDGALGFGHIACDLASLGCDFYSTSLHKWLLAPIGTGFLYVRRDRIKNLWPLFGAPNPESDDIRKFELVGRHPQAAIAAIGQSLDFYEAIGVERKQARLQYLKRYWADRLATLPNVQFSTSLEPEHSCAIVRVHIERIDAQQLSRYMLEQRGIYVFAGDQRAPGVYVAANVFTRPSDLDIFVGEFSKVARQGLPV